MTSYDSLWCASKTFLSCVSNRVALGASPKYFAHAPYWFVLWRDHASVADLCRVRSDRISSRTQQQPDYRPQFLSPMRVTAVVFLNNRLSSGAQHIKIVTPRMFNQRHGGTRRKLHWPSVYAPILTSSSVAMRFGDAPYRTRRMVYVQGKDLRLWTVTESRKPA